MQRQLFLEGVKLTKIVKEYEKIRNDLKDGCLCYVTVF